MEKLCGSIGMSFALIYLAFGIIYQVTPAGSEIQIKHLALVSLASLALGLGAWRDVVRLLHSFRVRQALAGFSFLLLWTLLVLGMIRNYTGANWYGDWLEHFQRSLFFLHHFPAGTPVARGYQLTNRPPAMNELAAFFLAQMHDRFEIFQLVFAFLNLLIFLPSCLCMPVLGGPRRTFVPPLMALFAMNPMVMQNVTYTWTKAFAAFYVVLGVFFYLAARRKNDFLRMTFAFGAVSMGFLVHYSAGPYLLFLTLHYIVCVYSRRPHRWREVTTIAAVCGLLLVSWFGWSIAAYGVRTTFTSNDTVTFSRRYPGSNLAKIVGNLTDSVVPVVLRNHFLLDDFSHQGLAGRIRDDAFIFYQTNAIFGMGLIGGPLILWLLYHLLFRRFRLEPERQFWLAMIPFCVIVGIASTGERDPLGKAQLTLLPLEILGLSLLASRFPLRRALLALVLTGCLVDCSFGIFLHIRLENVENSSQKTIFPGLTVVGGKQSNPVLTSDSLSAAAWNNWFLKHQYALSVAKLAELRQDHPDAVVPKQIQISLHEDELYWHGWYARHNGSIRFLGDDIAGHSGSGTTVLSWLLVLLMFGLMLRMLNYHATPIARRVAHARTPEIVGAGVREMRG